ncbi:MAG: hypothetical protein HY673_01550 [Chloroflexi bacterium]|nr:hypothetical protein [Chloroflexota bacterium]
MTTKNAYRDFVNEIKKTGVMDYLLKSIEQEPVRLFGIICQNFEKTGKAVPDHLLHPSGYVGEVALKALTSAGLIKYLPGDRLALFRYQPTEEGVKVYKKLAKEGLYQAAKKQETAETKSAETPNEE